VYKSANKTGVIDTMGNYIISPTISKIMEFSDGYALIMSPKFDYYFLGTDLKRHTIKNYTSAKNFCDGVAPVNNAGLWSIINNKGFELTSSKYQSIDKFKNGFAKVKISRKVGVVDEKGQIIAEPDFDYINYYGEGVFRVEKENSIGYLNDKGQWVWRNEY
jgi:hypothetical protein